VAPIGEKMRQARLMWYGRAMRTDEEAVVRTALRFEPAGRRPVGDQRNGGSTESTKTCASSTYNQTMRWTKQHKEPSMRTLQLSGIDARTEKNLCTNIFLFRTQ